MSLEITGFEPGDRPRWTELWRAYLDFYHTVLPDAVYDHTWSRILAGTELRGLAARSGDGIVVPRRARSWQVTALRLAFPWSGESCLPHLSGRASLFLPRPVFSS